MDFSSVVVQEDAPEVDGELATLISSTDGSSPKAIPPIWSEVSVTLCFPCCFT
jgi:sucrose-phosphate synthase